MRFERVAVTGGSGRLGRYVVEALRAHTEVSVLDLVPPDDARLAFHRVDVLEPDAVRTALSGHDAVVHLAGIDLDVPAAADTFIHVNTVGTWNVMQAAKELGIRRVVQCSSITATGLNEARPDFPPAYLPVDEDHPVAPVHPYDVSKLLQEEIGRSFNRHPDMEVLSLRLMMVMFPSAHAFVAERLRDPDGRWLSYYISPRDAGRAFVCALNADPAPFDTFFITAQDTCRDAATLNWLAAELGTLPDVRNAQLYEEYPRAAVFDGTRARDVLGFVAEDDWPATVRMGSLNR